MAMAPLLKAQNSGFFLDTSSGEPRFTQRLSWSGGANAMRFEVVIEREERGEYRRLLWEFTENSFIEISLASGKYRYRVIPHDFLDRPGTGTQWAAFEILAALAPEIHETLQEIIYSHDENIMQCEIHIIGSNIGQNAEIYLKHSGGDTVNTDRKDIFDNGARARLLFDADQLIPGDYEIFVKNESGLGTSIGITVAYPEPEEDEQFLIKILIEIEPDEPVEQPKPRVILPFYVNWSVLWTPFAPIYGESFGHDFQPFGVASRIGAISTKTGSFSFGVDFAIFFYTFELPSINEARIEFNLLFQKRMPDSKSAVTSRFGMGITMLKSKLLDSNSDTENKNTDAAYVNIGASFMWMPGSSFYMEAGLDYSHYLSSGAPSGAIRPCLGIGWQF
jgi:hypothetical protein